MEIALKNVSKHFGEQRAVDDISFIARKGITGFLGPNGAGKSTTMRMITGFLQPSAGTILLNGEPVWPTQAGIRAKIGYLPEHNPLYTDMYIREYLGFVSSVHKLNNPKNRIADVIELVGLGPELGKQIGQLSKGYRQRVGLAQALIHDPDVLILDEPTSGLDPNQLSEIRAVIQQMAEHKVVLLSTHIMQEVQALCERVLIINKGKLVADDPIDQLQARISGGHIIHLKCQKPIDKTKLAKLAGVQQLIGIGIMLKIVVSGEADLRPQVAQLCVDEGWGLLELSKEAASVEDAFQAITSKPKTT